MSDPVSEPLQSPVRVYVEVTDTVSIPYTTGIQRVVREIVARLGSTEFPDIDIVPVFKASPSSPFRRLTRAETRQLVDHPAGGAAGRRADSFGVLSPLVRAVGDTKLVYRTRIRSRHLRSTIRERRAHNEHLELPGFEPGSIFFDIEGSWFDPEPRRILLPRLTASGVTVMTMVHDVMPVMFPQWFAARQVEAFSQWLDAHLNDSRMFITNSKRTSTDLERLAGERGIDLDGSMVQVTLGADFSGTAPKPITLPSQITRFLLIVGTIEPRKNHQLVLDAWERLAPDDPGLGLVLVGKEGWMVDELIERIRTHPRFNRTLLWLGGIDDSELTWLYQNAFVTVVPSLYEGLGVPVIEALLNGCPVICSTGGALPEAGGGFAELVDPDDTDGLVRLLEQHMNDEDHHDRTIERIRSYEPPNWETTTLQTAAAIRTVARALHGSDSTGTTIDDV